MATYGDAGKNQFKLPNIVGNYSLVVNPTTKNVDIYQQSSQFQFTHLGVLDLKTNRLNFDPNASLTIDAKRELSKNLTVFRQQSVKVASAAGAKNAQELLLGNTQPDSPDRSGIGTGSTASTPTSFPVTSDLFKSEEFKNKYWLKYPEDFSPSQDRIVISQKNYIKPDVLSDDQFSTNNIVAALSKERFNTKENILGTVILPMPNDISESNVTAWGEDSLSSLTALIGGAALGAAGGIASFDVDQINQSVSQAANQVFSGDSAANETIKQLLSLNAAAAITKKFGININPEAFRSRITGTAINPNLELLFQGPKLRSFAFQFKMSPRSPDEARNIRYIIKFFKKGMAPKRNFTDTKAAYFLGAPNVFDIEFKSGNNELKSIGKIKTCALQQFSVNYTPDGFYAAYQDSLAGGSQPVSVTMSLAFTELTPLYNDSYEDTDTVGWDILNDGPTGEPSTPPDAENPQAATEDQVREAGQDQLQRQLNQPITPAIPGGVPLPGRLPGA